MKFAWIALAFFSLSAFGKSFDVKLNVVRDGVKIASPQVTVKENETATIIQRDGDRDRFITVEAGKKSFMGLSLKLAIGVVDAAGNRMVFQRTELIVQTQKTAVFETEGLKISVLAKEHEYSEF